MGMRETTGSLRLYFMLAGIVGIVRGVIGLGQVRDASQAVERVPTLTLMALAFTAISIAAVGVAAVIAGLGLARSLRSGALGAQRMLLGAFVVNLVNAALTAWVLGTDQQNGFITAIVAIAITSYLLVNVRRLAKEAMETNGPVAIVRP